MGDAYLLVEQANVRGPDVMGFENHLGYPPVDAGIPS